MIVVWLAVTIYALAAIIHTYEKYDRYREQRIRELVTREARNPGQAPMPQPVPVNETWLVSHDQAVSLLSLSLQAEFTETKNGTPSSVPTIIRTRTPSSVRHITLVTERSEVTSTGSLQGFHTE